MEGSPPPGAPQQAECSLVVVQPRQLQGAAVERLDGLPQLLVVVGGFQLVGGEWGVGRQRPQDPQEG